MFELLQLGGIPGGPELLILLLLAVLLFGASKIPKLARASGEAIGEFQKGREEVETELQEMREGATTTSDLDTETTTTSTDTAESEDDDFVDTEPVTAEDDQA